MKVGDAAGAVPDVRSSPLPNDSRSTNTGSWQFYLDMSSVKPVWS